jgi:hypothetical protein
LETAAFTLLALIALVPAAVAQSQRSSANYLQRATVVSVQYMIRMPFKSDDTNDQQQVMEEGRRRLYEIGSKECAVIISTLASTCTLTSLNVQSNFYRQRNEDNAITLTANAQYQVELKPATP